jgi:hypothetical protein
VKDIGANGWICDSFVELTIDVWLHEFYRYTIYEKTVLHEIISTKTSSCICFSTKKKDDCFLSPSFFVLYNIPNLVDLRRDSKEIIDWFKISLQTLESKINGWVTVDEVGFTQKVSLDETNKGFGRFRRPFKLVDILRIKGGGKIPSNHTEIFTSIIKDNTVVITSKSEWYALCWELKISNLEGVKNMLRYWINQKIKELIVLDERFVLRGEESTFIVEEEIEPDAVEGIAGLRK